jgi:hypothetical protein
MNNRTFLCITIALLLPSALLPVTMEDFIKQITTLKKNLAPLGLSQEENLVTTLDAMAADNTQRTQSYRDRITTPPACLVTSFKNYKLPAEWNTYPDISDLVKARQQAMYQAYDENSDLLKMKATYNTVVAPDEKDNPITQLDALKRYLEALATKIDATLQPLIDVVSDAGLKQLAAEDAAIKKTLAPIFTQKSLLSFSKQEISSFFVEQATAVLQGRINPLTTYTPKMFIDAFKRSNLDDVIQNSRKAITTARIAIEQSRQSITIQNQWRDTLRDAAELFLGSGITIAHARILMAEMTDIATKATKKGKKDDFESMEKDLATRLTKLQAYIQDIPEIKTTTEAGLFNIALQNAYQAYATIKNATYDHETTIQRIGLSTSSVDNDSPKE